MRRLVSALLIVIFFLIIGYVLLVYATGKRFSDGKLIGVGIIQVDTTPDNSRIYLNNKFVEDRDFNIENLRPGDYTIKVEKDNYSPWQKEVEVVEGKITPLKVKLFPSNPSLTAATFNGVFSPKISPDGHKIVFGIAAEGKRGLWVLDLEDPQLFFNNNNLRQVATDSDTVTFSNSTFTWSPDSNSLLVETKNNSTNELVAFVLNQGNLNNTPQNIVSRLEEQKRTWTEENTRVQNDRLKNLGSEAENLVKGAKELLFSKDNSAVIAVKEDNSAVVYDTKPTPVPGAKPMITNLAVAERYFWFQDGTKHIVALEKNIISLMDTDGTNKASIFTGDFDPSSVFSWPDGSRLVLSINLNSRSNPLPNLYTIDLR
jgi:dipeptidyl aminopeptidase/acylaminoacyl peptidase